MKAFNMPAIEVLKFEIADIITTSNTTPVTTKDPDAGEEDEF